jgi:hypothetical protein
MAKKKPRKIKAIVERKSIYTIVHSKSRKAVEQELSRLKMDGRSVCQKPKLIKGRYYASVKNQTLN